MRKTKSFESGQVLLIAVMMTAVLMTVVFSAAFVSRTDTQISKLEEENQRTLAAAEAGIEASLRSGANTDIGTIIQQGFEGTATVTSVESPSFISPFIKKDDQYTFYLSTPVGAPANPNFGSWTTPEYNNKALTVCSTSSSFAMSLTLLKSNYTVKRYIINPPSPVISGSGTLPGTSTVTSCPSGETFTYSRQLTNIEVGTNNLLLFIRLVGSGKGAKIGIKGTDNLPFQGRTVVSEAKSPSGVTKIVRLFQSYPQIPAEFFVTSF